MTTPVSVFAVIDAEEPDMARVTAAVAVLARQSLREAGCLRYDVYQSRKGPLRLVLHEVWADDAAVEGHRGSARVQAFKAALKGTTARVWASSCDLLDEGTAPGPSTDLPR